MRILCAMLLFAFSAQAEPVTVMGFSTQGDPAPTMGPLSERLARLGAKGDLVAGADRIWLVATTPPTSTAGLTTNLRMRLAPVVPPDTPGGTTLDGDTKAGISLTLDLKRAIEPKVVEVRAERSRFDNLPVLNVRFDAAGAKAFHALSRTLIDKKMAIVIDGRIMMAPIVREAISGGVVQVHLGARASMAEATHMAARLGVAPVPVGLRLLSEAAGTRVDDEVGESRVTAGETTLRYPTPKRWDPTACRLSGQPACGIAQARLSR